MSDYGKPASEQPPLDLREKGAPVAGGQQAMDRRLFVHFLAFTECEDASAVGRALEGAGLTGAVYADAHDPRGVGVVTMDENPDVFAVWDELPELADFQYLDGLKHGAEVLLEAEIQERTWPLLVHQRYGLGNSYILATGGTWRWQMQMPYEDQRHETFWRQLLQALAQRVDGFLVLAGDGLEPLPHLLQVAAQHLGLL